MQLNRASNNPAVWLAVILHDASIALWITVACALAARLGFPWELASHFFVQYTIAAIVLVLACGVLKRWRFAGANLVVLAFCLWKLIPLYIADPTAIPNNAPRITLAQSNVLKTNRSHAEVIAFVKQYDPDIVGFEEIDQKWTDALIAGLKEKYPYYLAIPLDNNFGIGLFSKLPMKSDWRRTAYGFPMIQGKVQLNGKTISILETHPVPPSAAQERNHTFQQIVQEKNLLGDRFIVMGDLNCSPWSPFFEDLVAGLNAKNSQCGFGPQLSWPTFNHLFLLRTSIDHFLTSKNIVTTKRVVAPTVHSDHFPLYAEMALVR